MGYYIRVLSDNSERVPVARLRERLEDKGLVAELKVTAGGDEDWTELDLSHPGGRYIAAIERNLVNDDESGRLGREEIAEFLESIEDCRPGSAVAWLQDYLPGVRVIYAFQVLSGADEGDGWDMIGAVRDALWNASGGIFQADVQGFSNKQGYHILWQFHDDVEGYWKMAVLDGEGEWIPFEMDVGDIKQRQAFFAGLVPSGATRL